VVMSGCFPFVAGQAFSPVPSLAWCSLRAHVRRANPSQRRRPLRCVGGENPDARRGNAERDSLSAEKQRARFRNSLREEKLVTPGDINRYTFSGCTWFSRQIARGSRLRLVVSCINAAGSQKNYNRGGVVALESAKNARPAHVKLYHDKEHHSLVQLPVVR
jgi:hypothetical protein